MVERAVGPGGGQRGALERGVQLGVGDVEPLGGGVERDGGADGERGGGGQRAVVDRTRRARRGEERLQRRHRVLGALELVLHRLEVVDDGPVAGREVGRLEHRAHLLERHVEVAEPADGLGGGDLVGAVVPVAARRVDLGRLEQADVVVVPERLHAQVRHLRELADGEARRHGASIACAHRALHRVAPGRRARHHRGEVVGEEVGDPHEAAPAVGSAMTSIDAWWCWNGPSTTA